MDVLVRLCAYLRCCMIIICTALYRYNAIKTEAHIENKMPEKIPLTTSKLSGYPVFDKQVNRKQTYNSFVAPLLP